MFEDSVVINHSHLLSQFPNGVLAMSMEIYKCRLLLPELELLLLEQLFDILDFCLRELLDITLLFERFQESEGAVGLNHIWLGIEIIGF